MSQGPWNDTVTAISAVLGLISAAAAAFGAWQSNLASEEASKAKSAAERAEHAFAELQYTDKRQRELYEKIESLLKEEKSGSLLIATTYVSLVDDPKTKAVWCEAIVNYARIREQVLTPTERSAVLFARECVNESRDQRMAMLESAPAAAPAAEAAQAEPTSAPAAPRLAVKERQVLAAGSAVGWDIDVFSCASRGQASVAAARRIADALADRVGRGEKLGDAELGRVRLRELSKVAETRGGFPSSKNQVQADSDVSEQRLAEFLRAAATEATGKPFTAGRSTSGTAYYLSVFACDP